ncbi:MATE family efflux transporter [Thioalkalivibrio sp. HK1]|uniref:MATE family efflux transporter n=1 Tax=Thioalkalivibrio sp. HK1 TaxID=1469245 RepID=UPI0004B76E81|nr:MATE family efflux transporter [Thioalkalivibrio sp. HK1]
MTHRKRRPLRGTTILRRRYRGALGLSLTAEIRDTVRLALPVMLARLGVLTIVVLDTAMSGRISADDLAWYSIAVAPQVPMLLIGIGALMGTVVMTAQAVGANQLEKCGAIWRTALAHAVIAGFLMLLLCTQGEAFFLAVGQSPEIAAGAGRVLQALGYGIPGMLLYVCTILLLEGIGRPKPGMYIMFGANILNLILNWIMVFGNWGFPAMGAEGAALASSIVRWCIFFAAAAYVLRYVDRQRFGIFAPKDPKERLGPRMRSIGLPMGLAQGLESSAFGAMMLIAGLMGTTQVGGFSIPMNLLTLAFMGAIGLATAASVRVGRAVGRGDPMGVQRAGWVAVGLVLIYMLLVATIFSLFRFPIIAIYTHDATVLALAATTLSIAVLVTLPDGAQAVIVGALRGASDAWPAVALYLIGFWGAMVPLGYWLAITQGMGAPGLMISVAAGALTTAILLALRFRTVSRRAVRRV